ncbi:transcriptional regulator GcvA [Pontibacterium granulatum]|uniref:transcriptional regulator GcvA n=1 Tax=Pontibacterium granulatum TaxID=2036029 RepID=UPI00249A1334|nr:transcriptional regulator GcvA [Pontibacterium granulatum]MDI3325195.1 transcriptional regulator GcvA [Pontibacterium granulatum]
MAYIPLMNALKTFVVAAKYLNFTKAADELLVSPSAVSHQIRILEDYLGLKLFSRTSRTMILTDAGYQLYGDLEGPFKSIAEAVRETMNGRKSKNLYIVLRPFFSISWLAPRLQSFWAQHPDIQIDLIHRSTLPDFSSENIDVAILWGKGHWPGMQADMLIPGNLTPICSRELIVTEGMPTTPQQLSGLNLIHDSDHSAWQAWFRLAGLPPTDAARGQIFDDTNVRVQAIINGQGVMLGCPRLLQNELASGELVRLFEQSLPDYAYYLVYPESRIKDNKTQAFIRWIQDCANQRPDIKKRSG